MCANSEAVVQELQITKEIWAVQELRTVQELVQILTDCIFNCIRTSGCASCNSDETCRWIKGKLWIRRANR